MNRLSDTELAEAQHRFKGALHLQEIEGNPLDAEQIAMFEMFDRERWPHEKCLEYIRARVRSEAGRAPAGKGE